VHQRTAASANRRNGGERRSAQDALISQVVVERTHALGILWKHSGTNAVKWSIGGQQFDCEHT
jgi:hypothetical protein